MSDAHLDTSRKHTVILLFDATDSNPNGDPDGGNAPRTDPETGQGLVSDVSLKRKIRDTVPAAATDVETTGRYGIFVTAGTALNANLRVAAEAVGRTAKGKGAKEGANNTAKEAEQQAWLRKHYFDVRMFGGVLSTGDFPAGKLTGPVQVEWARSIDPVVPTEHTITRVARTSESDDPNTQIGAKWMVPYGLYATRLHYAPSDGERAGVTGDDLNVLWQSLIHMFDHTRSAARPNMGTCALWVFSHTHRLGDCTPRQVSRALTVQRKADVPVARCFEDYHVNLDTDGLPAGLVVQRLV